MTMTLNDIATRQFTREPGDDDVMRLDDAKRAVIAVGGGRGIIVSGGDGQLRFVITAAHCLPFLPPCSFARDPDEYRYENLLGPLGEEPNVWTECLFADPMGDIAVLGPPDDQELGDEAERYEELTQERPALRIAARPIISPREIREAAMALANDKLTFDQWLHIVERPAWLLSLDGDWFKCAVHYTGRILHIRKGSERILGGMSGSPIVVMDGAIGVLSASCEKFSHNPSIIGGLPGWLLGTEWLNVPQNPG